MAGSVGCQAMGQVTSVMTYLHRIRRASQATLPRRCRRQCRAMCRAWHRATFSAMCPATYQAMSPATAIVMYFHRIRRTRRSCLLRRCCRRCRAAFSAMRPVMCPAMCPATYQGMRRATVIATYIHRIRSASQASLLRQCHVSSDVRCSQ